MSDAEQRRWQRRRAQHWHLAAALVLLGCAVGACFQPTYQEGVLCSEADTCPPSYTCELSSGICRATPTAPRPDARAPEPDAGPGDAGAADAAGPDAFLDLCRDVACGPGTCVIEDGDTGCDCDEGYDPGADGAGGETCLDIDECALSPSPCGPNSVCENLDGSFACACEDGYQLDPDSGTCELIIHRIVGAGTDDQPRQWSDGSVSPSCQAYRFSPAPYLYQGDTGDGVYLVQPSAFPEPVEVFCDMNTDGGGWTGIDPATAATFGGVASIVQGTGATLFCRVQDGLLETFYSGSGTRLLVCQYDIPLGFAVDTVRVSGAADTLRFAPVVTGAHTTDVQNFLALPWGQNVQSGGRGDVVIGTPAAAQPVIGLAEALGLSGTALRSFGGSETIVWGGESRATTASDTALRIQMSESGSENEGFRWTEGRVYVRHEASLPQQPATASLSPAQP
ncbi:calcium-binding EGF-like domain-containing protein [Haliangium ochraceum]|uniref:EGF calcium-binding domain protein n=1 Tax=Haliangium ochraceum (strain DSM 14365 / JCM 11303 / SMP-2) TaxID=502025 RepID=D0LX24_HALO1|nr:calcium-binding EGF-like domain-containing protein [Haliangium ochraceum]ACY16066.1 EGF calcium-binding domain protein [Haliangium ochraceum DSM 14365]